MSEGIPAERARRFGWRLAGAWQEMLEDPEQKIARPRQIYTGSAERDLVPIREAYGIEIGSRTISVSVSLQFRVRFGSFQDGDVGVIIEAARSGAAGRRSGGRSGDCQFPGQF